MDDLRTVQFEIEEKLVSANRKRKQLENKISSLEILHSKNDKETVHSRKDKRFRSTDSIEKKNSDERPKKSEASSNKAHFSSNHPKSKYIPLDPHQEISKPLKNDAPSRFWSLVEPYCADITQDTIRTIEDLIVPQESDKDFQEIPELGKHYSETWPLEDLKEEMIEGSKSVENNKGLFSDSAQDHTEVERILKLGEDESSSMEGKDEASLYDKLVYSLISENLMTHSDNIMTDDCDDDVVQRTNPDTVQEPTVADNSLEKRMRAAFVTAGLLEPDEEESKSEDDEISQEIKKIQAVLIPVQEYNTIQKKKLLSVAKAEMAKQEVKKKLQEHDAKVMEIYRTVAAARENKTMNKKLEDEVKKVLRERKKLEEKISQMQ